MSFGNDPLFSLTSPIGPRGSGRQRYAAAMHFYAVGKVPADMLEIYRRCINLDNEDPVDLARFEGIEVPPFLLALTPNGAL